MSFFTGTESSMDPYSYTSLNSLKNLIKQGGGLQQSPLFGAGQNYLQNLLSGAPGSFDAFQKPYMQNFEQNIVPGIAERFAGMGTGAGALNSSGLHQALGQAGSNLQTQLAGLHGQLQMQALPQALGYAQSPIQNILQAAGLIPGQFYETPGQPGFLQSLLGSFAHGAGSAVGAGLF